MDRFFSISNNAIHHMNIWVHTAGMYRATAILSRVHTAFFNYHYFSEMTNMPDKIVLASIMTVLDLEFERALHYHNEGYDSDNDNGLPRSRYAACMPLSSATCCMFASVMQYDLLIYFRHFSDN